MMNWHHILHHLLMSERLDLADAACPARFQPNFLRAAKPKAKTALKTLDWKQGRAHKSRALRDKTSEARSERPYAYWCDIDLIVYYTTAYSAGGHHSVTDPPEYRVSRF